MFNDLANIWLFILGLGVKAPTAEWGMMLNEARKVMFTHPEMMFAPGIAIVIIVMAFNFLSDALQIAIDPRISSKDKLRSVKRSGAIMTLLTVKHLTITDTWTDQPLVSDVNFTLTKGETLGVIGESGSGKSITCKSIVGLNPERLRVTGDITFDGKSMLSLSETQLKNTVVKILRWSCNKVVVPLIHQLLSVNKCLRL